MNTFEDSSHRTELLRRLDQEDIGVLQLSAFGGNILPIGKNVNQHMQEIQELLRRGNKSLVNRVLPAELRRDAIDEAELDTDGIQITASNIRNSLERALKILGEIKASTRDNETTTA